MATATTTMNVAIAPSARPEEAMDMRRVFAFLAMVFGMFMAILDIQIVSASLGEIQAGLAAGPDEIAWVQTSYLVAEVIMIPLSGFLGRLLSTRVLFTISAAGFTAASGLAATATNMDQMIVYRAIQGFIGGGMIPSVFAAAYTIFPPSKRSVVTPMIGLVATLAPTIGPTVGGYITDAASWHWLFFINVVPGILVTLGVLALVDFDEPNFALLDRFDWFGFAAMAGFLGSLEYVLEEGPQYQWFEDQSVAIMGVICAVSTVAFFYRVLTAKEPIVDIRAFTDRNFAIGSIFSFCVGIGLYGMTYIYPRYLAEIRGYNPLMIGETLFVSGLAMFMTAPLVGRLMNKVDPRYMIGIGLIVFAISTWQMTWITSQYDFYELLWPQIFRGLGIMLAMIPVNNIALGTLAPERMKNASGLFNLTRNMGGAVGLALINTVLNDRTDLHISRLHDVVNWGNASAVDMLNTLTQRFQGQGDAQLMALKMLWQRVHQQASVMAYADAFYLLTVFYVGLSLLVVVVKRPKPGAGAGAGH